MGAFVLALSVNSVKVADQLGTFDGIIACGGHAEGTTTTRHQRFGNPAPDAVYVLNVNQDSVVSASSCGSEFDTYLRIFDINGETEICGCDDCGDCGAQSVLDCDLSSGHYLLVVDGFNDEAGSFSLDITCPASAIECGSTEVGYTTGAGNDFGNEAGDVSYEFTLHSATTITASSCGSGFDTYLRVFSSDLTEEHCSCDDCGDCGLQTVLDCELQAGHYVLVVDGFSSREGDFEVALTCPQSTIECGGTQTGFTTGAASVVGSDACDVLYSFAVDTITDVGVSSCDSSYDTWLRILSADLATELCGCDDCGDCGLQADLACQINAGSYVVSIGGFSSAEGDFTLAASCSRPVMVCGGFYTGSTVGAASVTGTEAGDNLYSLEITETTHMTLSSCGSDYDTWLRIIHGDSADGAVACGDDCGDCGVQTVLTCTLLAGSYTVSVDGYASSEGNYEVSADCIQNPFTARNEAPRPSEAPSLNEE